MASETPSLPWFRIFAVAGVLFGVACGAAIAIGLLAVNVFVQSGP